MKKTRVLKSQVLPLNLQFFADSDGGSGDAGDGGAQSNNTNNNQEQPTITQSQMNTIATRENKEGRRAGRKEALKDLGFENEDEAKKAFSLYTAMMNSQKSKNEQDSEALTKALNEKAEAEKRATAIEAKYSILSNGVIPECVDDVLALATAKVTEDKGFDTVLKEMKKDPRYASFFNQSNSDTGNNNSGGNTGNNSGTGNSLLNNNSGGNTGNAPKNFGAQLAQEFCSTTTKKSSFFKEG